MRIVFTQIGKKTVKIRVFTRTRLGSGQNGEVYLVRVTGYHRLEVLKVPIGDAYSAASGIADEIDIGNIIGSHQHIVPVTEAHCSIDGGPPIMCLLMPHGGISLEEYFQGGDYVQPPLPKKIGTICLFLEHMQRAFSRLMLHGIASRDIKPANIVYSARTEMFCIIDLGNAKKSPDITEDLRDMCNVYIALYEFVHGKTPRPISTEKIRSNGIALFRYLLSGKQEVRWMQLQRVKRQIRLLEMRIRCMKSAAPGKIKYWKRKLKKCDADLKRLRE